MEQFGTTPERAVIRFEFVALHPPTIRLIFVLCCAWQFSIGKHQLQRQQQ